MALVNRDKDSSEQRVTFSEAFGLVATGLTLPMVIVPWPATLSNVQAAAIGISGSPTLNMEFHRMTAGGFTQISTGLTTLALQAVGTSGPQAGVIAAAGSTILNLIAGDVIVIKSGGANSAVAALSVAVVLQALQDVRNHYGS